MKKLFKTPCKTGRTSSRFTCIMLLLLMALGSVTTYAQTIGIIEGLTPVSIRQGEPFNGWPTVEFPILITPPGDYYANRFYKFDNSGNLVDIGATPKGYDASNNGWAGYCVQCLTSDFPQIYRAVTLNCNPGSVGPWKPDPYSDPTLGVATNNCTTSEAWSNPLTWNDYKVPNPATGGFYLNRNVTLDVNYDATNKSIQSLNGSALTINSGVTLISVNTTSGRFVNNGVLNGEGQYAGVVNNGVVSPGGNGIAQFQGAGPYTQNTVGTLDMQLASTASFDKLYWTSGLNVLSGTLRVSLLNGFVPVQNNSFNIIEMSYATYTGTFSNLDLPALPDGLKWKITYNPTYISLEVVSCIPQTYYADTDGDGYGDAGNSLQACEQPSGYVGNSTDCNDGNAAINPGALEVCDGIDNNCDGQIDEGFPSITYYRDADGDGYGNPAITTTSKCAIPAGYVANSTDCNDANIAVHPGAVEICGNGIDDNCNGQTDEGCSANTTLSINSVSKLEGNSGTASLVFVVTLNQPSTQKITVEYATANGTATSGSDFLATKKTPVTFKPGTTSVSIPVSVYGDKLVETDETFTVTLSNPVNATIKDAVGTGTILNDDRKPAAAMASVISKQQTENGSTKAVTLYPNPTSGVLNLQLTGYTGNVFIQLQTAEGKILRQQKLTASGKIAQEKINVDGFANGMYYLVVTDEKGNRNAQKVLVTH